MTDYTEDQMTYSHKARIALDHMVAEKLVTTTWLEDHKEYDYKLTVYGYNLFHFLNKFMTRKEFDEDLLKAIERHELEQEIKDFEQELAELQAKFDAMLAELEEDDQ
jgi:type I restriction-modification system DNA methylase subunit